MIPGIKVDTGLIVLGSRAVNGSEMPPWSSHVGRIKSRECLRQKEPTKLASWPKESLTWQAPWSTNAKRTLPVCPSLDYDLRADTHEATQQTRLHDAVFQSLASIARRELGPEQQSQITLPADMGGCAIRSPSRQGAGVAARWAALSDTLPRAQRALESLGHRGWWKQAWQDLDDVTNEMCKLGVVVCDGMPAVDPRLHDVIAACPSAQLAYQNVTLGAEPDEPRTQQTARKVIDIVTLSRFWKQAPSNARETIQSVAGPGTGLLWRDCSRDERNGWLQDHHFQQDLLNRLSLPRVAPGNICALAPQTGAQKGQLCGLPLDSFGRHSHGA